MLDRPDEMKNPFLPGDASNEKHDRNLGVHAKPTNGRGVEALPVFVGVDPVVNDGHTIG
jgi:hypothetical protein